MEYYERILFEKNGQLEFTAIIQLQIILSNECEWQRLFEILERASHYFGHPFVLKIFILKKETVLTHLVMINF